MRIEEWLPCPRYGHRRVVQRGRGAYVCFQCRYGWSIEPDVATPRERWRENKAAITA